MICLLRGEVVAELVQGRILTVANDVAELPWRHAEGSMDVILVLELLDELVENLTRLLSLKTDQAGYEVAACHVQVRAVKGSNDRCLREFALRVLSRVDVEGDLFAASENVREGHHAMIVFSAC